MKIDVVSKKLIKPSTPTPSNLNNYKISFTDELCPPMFVRILISYQQQPKRIRDLEESLAGILPRFYPLAGRYNANEHSVDCRDQGAEFIEAEAPDVESMDVVGEMEAGELNHLLSRQFYQVEDPATCPMLSIQVTRFKCGGLTIGISVSHKIFDASSLETFVSAWSEYNAGGVTAVSPSFHSPELFPRGSLDCSRFIEDLNVPNLTHIVKRFWFTNEAITRLRSKLGRKETISRVRVVCAVVAKALIAVDRERNGRSRPCILAQAVNMRARTAPPQPKHSIGNLVVQSFTRCISADEAEKAGVGEFVDVFGDAIGRTTMECSRILSAGEEGLNEIMINPVMSAMEKFFSGEANVLWFTDWSKFGFHEADFGWGKPAWARVGAVAGESVTVLTANKDGDGIEAWVPLKSSDISYFEQDEEIKLYSN